MRHDSRDIPEDVLDELGLNPEWVRLLKVLMSHPWGEATVVLKHGVPVMVKGIREDVKLSE